MYKIRTKGYTKKDPVKRWALPDRVFLAAGACHILAYAFLARYGTQAMQAWWIKPAPGFTGNHIFVATADWAFDYHGYVERQRLIDHYWRRARHWLPGWDATLVALPQDALISEAKSRAHDGLWLREPGQFLHDAMPRAEAYLDRFPPPPG